MSFIYDFADNKSISADNLNSVISQLGSDVTASNGFADNTAYAVSRLNLIRSEIMTGGILTGMTCSSDGVNVTVGTGVCFFDNGMRLEITEPEIMPLFPDVTNYIYMYASPLCTAALPIVSAEEKSGSDFVPVAEVSGTGVTDRRIFCQAKVPLAASSRVTQRIDKLGLNVPISSSFVKVHEIKLENKGFSKIFIAASTFCCGIYDRDSRKFEYTSSTGLTIVSADTIPVYHGASNNIRLKFEVNGDMLEFYCTRSNNTGASLALPITITVLEII